MTATIILYSVASALCAVSSHWWDLAIYRFFVGLGIGGEASIGPIILSEFWANENNNKQLWAMSIMKTSFPIGAMLTGLFNLGSGQFGWRYLFLIGLIPAVVTLYIRATLKEPQKLQEMKKRRDQLLDTKTNLLNSKQQILENPLKEIFAPKYRLVSLLVCTIITSATVAYWAGTSWMPAWINQLTGTQAVEERSLSTICISLGSIVAILLMPMLMSKLGYVRCFKLSFLSSLLIAFGMFAFVHSYKPVIINLCSFGIGLTATMPWVIVCSYLPKIYPTHILGTGAGVAWAVGRFFTAVVGLCVGPIIALFHGSYGAAAATVTLIYALGFIAAFKLSEPDEDLKLASPQT